MQWIQKFLRNGFVAVGIVAMVVCSGAGPVHPERLDEKLRQYVASRVGEFDSIPQQRRDQLRQLAAFIREKVKADRPARLIFICTHNSRRSQMCQVWAATAAAYFGVRHVENFSGGTEVTAFNARAVAALRRAGLAIDDPATAQNPHYRVRFHSAGTELECFSKVYGDASNPKTDFSP